MHACSSIGDCCDCNTPTGVSLLTTMLAAKSAPTHKDKGNLAKSASFLDKNAVFRAMTCCTELGRSSASHNHTMLDNACSQQLRGNHFAHERKDVRGSRVVDTDFLNV